MDTLRFYSILCQYGAGNREAMVRLRLVNCTPHEKYLQMTSKWTQSILSPKARSKGFFLSAHLILFAVQ